ncbi:SAM-dependent methyltransferase [Desulfovibrio sp. OttesenSCG-928-O18]|nr:SAM-dependent methyltransferase [Desulfovibrio sp. OttesenSCG-928-O18]
MTKEWTAREMLELSGMYWKTSALQAGVVLDLFTALDAMAAEGKRADIASLARAVQSDERALGMLVTALTAMGFLGMDQDGILLPEHSRKYLSRESDEYIGFIIKHHMHIMPAWSKLAEAVQSGRSTREVSSSDTDDAAERESFLMGMFNVAMHQAEKIAAALDLSGRNRLLDLGGGPGTYAVFFSLANPGLCATIFDRPTSEPIARNVVRRFGLEDRVGFAGGDFLLDPLPEGYDVAWLSQVLHGEAPADAAKLVARAGKTLNPGGLLVIQEFVVDNDRRGPEHPALFSLNMLVGTQGGQAYTWAEIEAMLKAAGAVSVSRLDIALPQGCGILVGRMPG